MRRSPSIEPFTPSPNVQLHPTLQAVLDSLDVQIEAELSRYRRQRRQPNARPRRQTRLQDPTALGILQQNIQLPTLGSSLYEVNRAAGGQVRGQAGGQVGTQIGSRAGSPLPPSVPQPARPAPTASSGTNQAGVAVWSAAATPAPASHPGGPSIAFGAGYPGVAASPAMVNRAMPASAPIPNLDAPSPEPASEPELSSAEIASYANQYDLSAYVPNSTLQRLMQQASMSSGGSLRAQPAVAAPEDAVDGYLASSEELLRSIAEETRDQPADREPNSMLDTLLTPLGVGSMLLLLLASTTLGYVMMNPASVGLSVGSSTDSGSTSGSVPSSQPAPTAAQTMRGPAADQTPLPNLAADEFVDLGLDTLSTIPRAKGQRPKAAASAKPAPVEAKPAAKAPDAASSNSRSTEAAPATQSAPPPAAVVMPTVVDSTRLPELPARPSAPPNLETVVVPARPPISETPPVVSTNIAPVSPEPIRTAPPPIQPAPAADPTPEPAPGLALGSGADSSRYYVVTDYSGDASLETARTAVPDAYVRNLPDAGAKVQLGSFNDEAGAEGLRQQLQQQGIEAEVYRP